MDDITVLFYGNTSLSMDEFRKMIRCNITEETLGLAQKFMEHLEINGRGAVIQLLELGVT